jgi:iron complex outermembrane receptor protein
MWNWRMTPAVSLTNAVRIDHLSLGRSGSVPAGYPFTNADWNRSTTHISFNSAVVWTVTPVDKLRLIASRGVQLPNLVQSGAMLLDLPFLQVTGDPRLKPTVVTNYELAWDHDLPTFDVHLQISAFHQQTDNLISIAGNFIATPTSFYATSANIGSSSANGMELSAKGALDDAWRWSVSYRAEFVDDNFLPFAVGGVDVADYEHTTPNHLFKASLGWARGDWEADTYLNYQSRTLGLRSTVTGSALAPVGAYVSLDARIAYRLTDWATLAISGQNLLQSPQQQTSGPDVERRVFATLSTNY